MNKPLSQVKPDVSIASKPERDMLIGMSRQDEKFKPKGAIAFFVLLFILTAAIWFAIYAVALTRV